MALTRRRFVQAAGLGAAGTIATDWIGARGRENALWSLVESHASGHLNGISSCFRVTRILLGLASPS